MASRRGPGVAVEADHHSMMTILVFVIVMMLLLTFFVVLPRKQSCSEVAGESTGHDGHVQSQSRRDEKTMQIFTALLVFVGVLTGGAILLVLAHLAVGVGDEVAGAAFMAITASASVLAVTYLVRHDRRR